MIRTIVKNCKPYYPRRHLLRPAVLSIKNVALYSTDSGKPNEDGKPTPTNPFKNNDGDKTAPISCPNYKELDKILLEGVKLYDSENQLEQQIYKLPITKELWYQCFYSINSSFSQSDNVKHNKDDNEDNRYHDAILMPCIYPGSTEFAKDLVENLSLATKSNLYSLDVYDLAHLCNSKQFNFNGVSINDILPLYATAQPNLNASRDELEDDIEDYEESDYSVTNYNRKSDTNYETIELNPTKSRLIKRRQSAMLTGFKKILNRLNDKEFIDKMKGNKDGNWIIHFKDAFEFLYHPYGALWIQSLYNSIQQYNNNSTGNKIILISSLHPSHFTNYHFQNSNLTQSPSLFLETSTLMTNCIQHQTERFMSLVANSNWANKFIILNVYPNLLPQEKTGNHSPSWTNYDSTHHNTKPNNDAPLTKGNKAGKDYKEFIKEPISWIDWIEKLKLGWNKRILHINLQNLSLTCQARNIKLEQPSQELIKLSFNTMPFSLHRLTKVPWPKAHLQRLVATALGAHFSDPSHTSIADSKGLDELKWKYILKGLQFVKEPAYLPDSLSAIMSKSSALQGADFSSSPSGGCPRSNPSSDSPTFGASARLASFEPSIYAKSEPTSNEKPKSTINKADCDNYEKKLLSCIVNSNQIKVGFEDICLPSTTINSLQNLITLPLLRPGWFQKGILRDHFISGVLLFGPPGTGKTLLAKAVAKESGSNVLEIKGSDVYDKYVGEGEKNVKAIFSLARKLKPCVIFIDEVDALFGSRKNDALGSSGKREIINQFMAEWDGLSSSLNQDIIILAATNRPFDLDDAILRRLPRRLMVDLPSKEARRNILDLHLKDELIDSSITTEELAELTKNYSGSDIRNLCVAAAIASVRDMYDSEVSNTNGKLLSTNIDNRQHNHDKERVIREKHFKQALTQIVSSTSDLMQSLIELRKWDSIFGDKASNSKPLGSSLGFKVEDSSSEDLDNRIQKTEVKKFSR